LFVAPSALSVIVFACGSESPKFILVPDASDEQPAEDSGFDADGVAEEDASGEDAGTIVDATVVDSPDYDALIVEDAGGRIDASGCTSCDCDNDTFLRADCVDAGDAGDAGADAAVD